MSDKIKLRHLLLLSIFAPPGVHADVYAGLATTLIKIKTDAGSTSPVMADVRLGYTLDAHKLELAVMSSIRDDNLNQLVTDIPIATSLFYRYITNPRGRTHFELILGYSKVDIESSYIQVPSFTETFRGVSFGFGFEEALKSVPQLKFKIDFVQLYRGDQLNINSFTAGFNYAF
ncbi:MAG: outer membrane beta-barrel protein [Gammaproteobacteria bacterium]